MKNLEIVVVADANVLLAAAVGKAAQKAFYKPIDVYTTQTTYNELLQYLPGFCEMYNVSEEDAKDQINKLQLNVKNKGFYKSKLLEAWELIGKRDPKDVDILALTLKRAVFALVGEEEEHLFSAVKALTFVSLLYESAAKRKSIYLPGISQW